MKKRVSIPSIFPVTCHTDHVGPGSTFIAVRGHKEDGISHIPSALEKGATTIVIQNGSLLSGQIEQKIIQYGATLSYVENTRAALADLSAHATGYPQKKLKIVGITGTKGKTTTTYLVEHILKVAGYKTARICSGENSIAGTHIITTLTTPPSDYLYQFLAQCVNNNVEWVVLEIAAHALAQERIRGVLLDGIIFTNFAREHLEYFADLNDYFTTKLRILNHLKPSAPAFINGDNPHCRNILHHYPQAKTFGLDNKKHDITALVDTGEEHRLSLTIPINKTYTKLLCPALLGRFNAYNIVGAIGLALELGIPMETIAAALYSFEQIPGRQEKYNLANGATGIIDYAHTPDSYEAILSLLRLLTHHLIVVFGHGGERDQSKRPLLGAAAAQFADIIILTSDNPRSENPQKIIDDIVRGIPKSKRECVITCVDRETAITKAYECSQRGSIIAILGKGAEEYQIIGNRVIDYSDKKSLLRYS